MSDFYSFEVKAIDGSANLLAPLRGKVTLAVNVASKCGLTPQYEGLERLQRELGGENFTVVGFPCNQFGAQEPGSAQEIRTFCSTTYGVTFPLSEKLEVNGAGRNPLYSWLTAPTNGFPGDTSPMRSTVSEAAVWAFGNSRRSRKPLPESPHRGLTHSPVRGVRRRRVRANTRLPATVPAPAGRVTSRGSPRAYARRRCSLAGIPMRHSNPLR